MTNYEKISNEDGEILVKTARKVVEEYLISKNKMKLSEKNELLSIVILDLKTYVWRDVSIIERRKSSI